MKLSCAVFVEELDHVIKIASAKSSGIGLLPSKIIWKFVHDLCPPVWILYACIYVLSDFPSHLQHFGIHLSCCFCTMEHDNIMHLPKVMLPFSERGCLCVCRFLCHEQWGCQILNCVQRYSFFLRYVNLLGLIFIFSWIYNLDVEMPSYLAHDGNLRNCNKIRKFARIMRLVPHTKW